MPREIYNEGRVIGYSAYEIYVRHLLAENPNATPASEQEWLSSMLKAGSSLVLTLFDDNYDSGVTITPVYPASLQSEFPGKVYSDDDRWYLYIDVLLPENTNLVAANTITASFFMGSVRQGANSSPWARGVTSYGTLLHNGKSGTIPSPSNKNVAASPDLTAAYSYGTNQQYTQSSQTYKIGIEHNLNVSGTTYYTTSTDVVDALTTYSRIIDGVVIQPDKWVENTDNPTIWYADLEPSFGNRPMVRFLYEWQPISEDEFHRDVFNRIIPNFIGSTGQDSFDAHKVTILLSGFTYSGILPGMVGLDGSQNTAAPENGDFLGPAVYPWANKIVMTMSNAEVNDVLKPAIVNIQKEIEDKMNEVPQMTLMGGYSRYQEYIKSHTSDILRYHQEPLGGNVWVNYLVPTTDISIQWSNQCIIPQVNTGTSISVTNMPYMFVNRSAALTAIEVDGAITSDVSGRLSFIPMTSTVGDYPDTHVNAIAQICRRLPNSRYEILGRVWAKVSKETAPRTYQYVSSTNQIWEQSTPVDLPQYVDIFVQFSGDVTDTLYPDSTMSTLPVKVGYRLGGQMMNLEVLHGGVYRTPDTSLVCNLCFPNDEYTYLNAFTGTDGTTLDGASLLYEVEPGSVVKHNDVWNMMSIKNTNGSDRFNNMSPYKDYAKTYVGDVTYVTQANWSVTCSVTTSDNADITINTDPATGKYDLGFYIYAVSISDGNNNRLGDALRDKGGRGPAASDHSQSSNNTEIQKSMCSPWGLNTSLRFRIRLKEI